MKEFGKRLFGITGERMSTNFLRQRSTMCKQNGNVAVVMVTVLLSSSLQEVLFFRGEFF